MNQSSRPYVWQMVKEAVETLGSPTTNVEVKEWILKRYPGTNPATIQCQIIACTVNHDSRVHYNENVKPRLANTIHDFLYKPEKGSLELYDPSKHGQWQIEETEEETLRVCQIESEPQVPTNGQRSCFAAEFHLRDYLAKNLEEIEPGLQLFVDEDDRDGVEYQTEIGRIDILAVDAQENFVNIELKVGQGPDAVSGQLMRYKSWVKRHLANGKKVRGIIVAQRISEKVRYALADVEDVYLKEYDLKITLRNVPKL